MGRTAGTPNKITAQVRERLDNLIEGLVNSISIDDLNTNQKIKMLQIALQYTLPRLQATMIKEHHEDKPLFVDEICVFERKKGLTEETESEVWADNFEVTQTYPVKIRR